MFFLLSIERDARYKKWKMAVERSLGWAAVKKSDQMTGKLYNIMQECQSIMSIFKVIYYSIISSYS